MHQAPLLRNRRRCFKAGSLCRSQSARTCTCTPQCLWPVLPTASGCHPITVQVSLYLRKAAERPHQRASRAQSSLSRAQEQKGKNKREEENRNPRGPSSKCRRTRPTVCSIASPSTSEHRRPRSGALGVQPGPGSSQTSVARLFRQLLPIGPVADLIPGILT